MRPGFAENMITWILIELIEISIFNGIDMIERRHPRVYERSYGHVVCNLCKPRTNVELYPTHETLALLHGDLLTSGLHKVKSSQVGFIRCYRDRLMT